ncbi:helix-turn-helix transcriptional regulator [Cupriavidus basilensis]
MTNLDQKVDLATLAEQVGLSRFHFTRAFKSTFECPSVQIPP